MPLVLPDLTWAEVGLIAIGVVGLVLTWFLLDDRRESRRRRAIDGAVELKSIGLAHVADLLTCYAVGDYTGMAKRARSLARLARSEGGAAKIAMALCRKMLPELLKHPDHGPELRKLLSANTVATPSATPNPPKATQ
jgi:hypothetical protein